MPSRHGLFRLQTGAYLVRLGIAGIYSRVQMQVFAAPLSDHDAATHGIRSEWAMHQRMHTQEVFYRLLESLHFLQHNIENLEEHMRLHDFTEINQRHLLSRRAGITADSVLQYLGLFLDGVGRTIPMVVLNDPEKNKVDSLSKAIKAAEERVAFARVKEVCSELSRPDSWWSIGFQRIVGIRQRITHYPDLVSFIGRGGNGRMNAVPYVHRAARLELMNDVNFIESLSTILAGMCEWLDRLEAALNEILVERAEAMGARLIDLPLPEFLAPSVDLGDLLAAQLNYLYLPLCSGSARAELTGN